MRDYLPLGSFSPALSGACSLTQPAPVRLTLDSPAVDVMTDFARVRRDRAGTGVGPAGSGVD